LVKRYQAQYLKAKKRDKPAVASILVEKIREKGGRFLRRMSTTAQGQVLWVDIGDDRAREKTCQALREGAPEIRRKRKTTSADEDDPKNETDETLSASSSIDRSASIEDDTGRGKAKRTPILRNTMHGDYPNTTSHQYFPKDEPIMIRPSAFLVRRKIPEAISVDTLDPHEREMYLRDFLPPDPGVRQKTTNNHPLNPSTFSLEGSRRNESANPWPVVKV
jgi:hypothetical protein